MTYTLTAMKFLFRFFASLKTAILLIALLTIMCIAGTLIPQTLEPQMYLAKFGSYGYWILALGADDFYHSTLFSLLLALLSISTLVCTLVRFRATRVRMFHRLQQISISEVLSLPVQLSTTRDSISDFHGFTEKPKYFPDGSELHFQEHGRSAVFGGLLIHIGFLLILLGGLMGKYWGVEMALRGRPRETIPVPSLKAIRAAATADKLRREYRLKTMNLPQASGAPQTPELALLRSKIEQLSDVYRKGIMNPDFKIRVLDLWVDYHAPTAPGQPRGVKSWNSRVMILQNEQPVASSVIRVNEPFSYNGFTFYQADWSKRFSKVHLDVFPVASDPTGLNTARKPTHSCTMTLQKPFKPDWSPYTLIMLDFLPDFRIHGTRFISMSDELKNPAARIAAYDQSGAMVGRAWAFGSQLAGMNSHVSNLPFAFSVTGAEPTFETGLQMTYDPGVYVVWFGCALMTMGMFLTFYVFHREKWVAIRPDGDVILAISGNRPETQLVDELGHLYSMVSKTDQLPANAENNTKETDE